MNRPGEGAIADSGISRDPTPAGPVLDIRVRWRAGQVALGLAGVVALAALFRPLRPGTPPGVQLAVLLALGLGVTGTALLASLKGRGPAELLAFHAFLVLCVDAGGQIVAPLGWPAWPLMALLLASLAVAEPWTTALGAAALASLLEVPGALSGSARPAVATALGYVSLVLAVNHALKGEKRRLSTTLAELARLRHGIDQFDEVDPKNVTAPPTSLRQISEEGRRARQVVRAEGMSEELQAFTGVARLATGAHAVLYFEVDREREVAYPRAWTGPPSLATDCVVPLSADPFAFVLERRQSFYATDYKRLLWSLPYYKEETKIGSLLAVPVLTNDVVRGLIVADRIEVQAFTGAEPELLASIAAMAATSIVRFQANVGREELGDEFKAVYPLSRDLTALTDKGRVFRLLLRSAQDIAPLEAAAVVVLDEAQTRYKVEAALGWAKEFEAREVGQLERTWAAWLVGIAEEPHLLDNLSGESTPMPIFVLDEGGGRAESLLGVPLRTRNKNLGALILTGRRGSFKASSSRVLAIVANQAAAALATIQILERMKEEAMRDGLTGLFNRRALRDLLAGTLSRESRHGGRFAVLMIDLDHFKRLNDTYGHPAGDAALKGTARALEKHLRKEDQAARYGGEEFAVILPGSDEVGALNLAERVRLAIEKSQVIFEGARITVTASLGAAVWPGDGADADALLSAADHALYAAKQAGRNRVVAASSARSVPAPAPRGTDTGETP